MSNPLKDMFGKSNPISSMMNVMANPQQAVMEMLRQRDPQSYQMVQQMMASGEDPQKILSGMTSKMSPEQVEQLKQMASQFGIR